MPIAAMPIVQLPVAHPAVTHGTPGLFLAYFIFLVPMIVGLVKRQASTPTLLSALFWAIPGVLVVGIANTMLHVILHAAGLPKGGFMDLISGILNTICIGYGSAYLLTRSSKPSSAHRRGAVVTPEEAGIPTRRLEPGQLSIAGVPIAKDDEMKHFKFIGTTGTGKSTAIREILNAALARGDRAVIADPDGGYLNNFYNETRGDVILNPFMPEAVKWNALAEITKDQDVDQLARSLIPDSGDPDRTWSEHARTFFISVTQQVLGLGVTDDAELYRFLTQAPVEELRKLLAGTTAGPLLEAGNERMFGSVRGTAITAVRALYYTTRQRAPSFSVRNWVRNGAATHAGGAGGALFIPYKAGEIAALRSVISAWMRIAIFEAMDRREGDQRLWFVVDELDALGEIDGLKDALARLRKFGGRAVIGFQSIAHVSGTYGKASADTIVENCGNTLILRCSASERGGTSEFASKLIGQREVLHVARSISRRVTEWFESITKSEQVRIEPAVMVSEIERLADLEGFLKMASVPDWMRVRLVPVRYPDIPRAQAQRQDAQEAAPPTVEAGNSSFGDVHGTPPSLTTTTPRPRRRAPKRPL
ncbi:MAG: type IV secretion system DNA-binding domain-containing protein [Proteobacteria bacterium]|nr:type IV secretion system DNA-binding domain-containing protein [Pseudomonadota bacterium]